MELIKEFGVDPYLLIAQIINFLIIFYLLKRFAYKPILEVLKKREETIKQGLQEAEEARILLEKTEEREKDILKKAQAEAKKMLDETNQQRAAMLKQSEEDTRKQVEKMLAEAREQIQVETHAAEQRLSTHVSKLAVEFLEKSLHDLFTEKEQTAIMQQAVKRMKGKAD